MTALGALGPAPWAVGCARDRDRDRREEWKTLVEIPKRGQRRAGEREGWENRKEMKRQKREEEEGEDVREKQSYRGLATG